MHLWENKPTDIVNIIPCKLSQMQHCSKQFPFGADLIVKLRLKCFKGNTLGEGHMTGSQFVTAVAELTSEYHFHLTWIIAA